MLPKENIILVIDELKPLLSGGATFSSLYRALYYTRKLRYLRHDQYKHIDPLLSKICTKNKLKQLCELKYLKEVSPKVYTATNKVMPVLQQAKFLTRFLPAEPEGTGGINALNNTEVFIQALKIEHYYDLIFPNFGYIEPDALLIQKNEDKLKLTFLEIEAQKYGWADYLEKKKENYLLLAKDLKFYDYWKNYSRILNLKELTQQELKFSVTFICSLQKDFGEGFNFLTKII
jgi:hypothetical protein